MKRLLYPLLIAMTLLSALVCLTTIVLWIRSYSQNENLHWFGDGRELSLRSCRGEFDGYRVWSSSLRPLPTKFSFFQSPARAGIEGRIAVLNRDQGIRHVGPVLGFALFYDPHPGYAELFVEVVVPWWFLTVLSAIFSAIGLRRWLEHRRTRQPGCCQSCGYDLRATPDRCPECGAIVDPQSKLVGPFDEAR